jgi:hypothetical protein
LREGQEKNTLFVDVEECDERRIELNLLFAVEVEVVDVDE